MHAKRTTFSVIAISCAIFQNPFAQTIHINTHKSSSNCSMAVVNGCGVAA